MISGLNQWPSRKRLGPKWGRRGGVVNCVFDLSKRPCIEPLFLFAFSSAPVHAHLGIILPGTENGVKRLQLKSG